MSKSDCALSCLFRVGFSLRMWRSSFMRSFMSFSAWSMTSMLSQSMVWVGFACWCCLHAELDPNLCSFTLLLRIRMVFPMYVASHSVHLILYITSDFSSVSCTRSLNGKRWPTVLGVWKATLKSKSLKLFTINFLSLLPKSSHFLLVYGNTMNLLFSGFGGGWQPRVCFFSLNLSISCSMTFGGKSFSNSLCLSSLISFSLSFSSVQILHMRLARHLIKPISSGSQARP